MGSSQSRVAKIEAGDPSVTIDLVVRAILATGRDPAGTAARVYRWRKDRGLKRSAFTAPTSVLKSGESA
jgi:hypothetical protein